MSEEWRTQGQNVWSSLGNTYLPSLTGVGTSFSQESAAWEQLRQINNQSRRLADQYRRSLSASMGHGDVALLEALNKMNQFALVNAQNRAIQAIRNIYESNAQALASQAAMTPDDIKKTVKGPDTATQLGQLGMQAASLMTTAAAMSDK